MMSPGVMIFTFENMLYIYGAMEFKNYLGPIFTFLNHELPFSK